MITKKDLKGAIASFPLDVVEMIMKRMEEETGFTDVSILQDNPNGAFVWRGTPEGQEFLEKVLINHDWAQFWKRYPSDVNVDTTVKKPIHKVTKTKKVCPECGRLPQPIHLWPCRGLWQGF